MPEQTNRDNFLLEMYRQMFANINRHILIVWQSVAVLIGSFTLLVLAEKQILLFDVAITLIILFAGWFCAHVIDANQWFLRNLLIITNIERQFLNKDDLVTIHYLFRKHKNNKLITQFQIQMGFGVIIAIIMTSFHVFRRVIPGIHEPISQFEPSRALPYICLIICLIYLIKLKRKCSISYSELLTNSPGKSLESYG